MSDYINANFDTCRSFVSSFLSLPVLIPYVWPPTSIFSTSYLLIISKSTHCHLILEYSVGSRCHPFAKLFVVRYMYICVCILVMFYRVCIRYFTCKDCHLGTPGFIDCHSASELILCNAFLHYRCFSYVTGKYRAIIIHMASLLLRKLVFLVSLGVNCAVFYPTK